eukprot:CAMPEP_0181414954 /NCGR_PEP_ID=MMETSP1110-20121109/9769_1 /TAXON_ID=174948 /ORGANISM="Symbiodinium sp., Strain CCMP421" /LENGTH=471 /DNA_ID=CAMNT_0023537845 /DNA_START=33 /DNA_END=1446 /DNA_ORIENTATION=-
MKETMKKHPLLEEDDAGYDYPSPKGKLVFTRCLSDDEPPMERDSPLHAALSRTSTSFNRQVTAPAVMQVANFFLDAEMTVLYEGNNSSLTNSKVRRSSVISCKSDETDVVSADLDVAVKSVSLADDASNLAMLRRECEILRRLGHHPHIMSALAYEECECEMILVTRLASEGDLSRLAPIGSCLEELQVRRLTQQLLSAFQYLEEKRIVHGDVKPQNVLISLGQGAFLAQLTDFGLSREIPEGEPFVLLEHVQGSYGFVPSEVKHKRQLSFAADLFALGVMTFRLLSSYDPFYPASAVDSELLFDSDCWEPLSSMAKDLRSACSRPTLQQARGTASELLSGDKWLQADEAALALERGSASPTPLPIIGFHSLEAAAELWKALHKEIVDWPSLSSRKTPPTCCGIRPSLLALKLFSPFVMAFSGSRSRHMRSLEVILCYSCTLDMLTAPHLKCVLVRYLRACTDMCIYLIGR